MGVSFKKTSYLRIVPNGRHLCTQFVLRELTETISRPNKPFGAFTLLRN
jgi:hypothetical protein